MEENIILEIYVKTNSKKSTVEWDEDVQKYVVHVKNRPIKGKANKEILKLLKEYFDADVVTIDKGVTSTLKTITVQKAKKEIKKEKIKVG